jgi:molybdopterin converting factor small subunit
MATSPGTALAGQGRVDEGIAVVQEGLAQRDCTGTQVALSHFRASLAEAGTVRKVAQSLGVPADRVAMFVVNVQQCPPGTALHEGDRVILIPADVAALWRFLGLQNLGADSVFDF